MRAVAALTGEKASPRPGREGAAGTEDSSGSSSSAEEGQTAALSSEEMEDADTPVHYFVMGPEPSWQSTSAWPPPDLAPKPYNLFLGGGASSRRAAVHSLFIPPPASCQHYTCSCVVICPHNPDTFSDPVHMCRCAYVESWWASLK